MPDGEAWNEAELDSLAGDRVGARDHRLAGDYRRNGRQHHDRHEGDGRKQPVERVLDRCRLRKDQCPLREIVENQRRKYQTEPRGLDGLAAKMSQVGVESFPSSHCQEHKPECHQADLAVVPEKGNRMERIDRCKQAWIVEQMWDSRAGNYQEPQDHHRTKESGNPSGATGLHCKHGVSTVPDPRR